MYLQFGRNIAPVRDDRMRRNKQALGDLLVGQTLHHSDDNFLFACAQQLLRSLPVARIADRTEFFLDLLGRVVDRHDGIETLHQAGIGQGTLERDQPQRLLLQFPEHLLVCQRRIDNQHIGSRFGDQFLQLFSLPRLDDLHVECRQPSKDITHTAAQNQRRLDQDDFQESAHRASRILRSTSATAGMNSLFSRSLWEASSDSQRKMSNNTPFISLPQLSKAG